MRNSPRETAAWLGVYVVVVVAPLAIATVGDVPPGRGFWLEFGVGLGFIGLAMMWLQFALTARFRWIAPSFGLDTLLQFHRQAGLVGFAFILAHPLVLFAADTDYLHFLNPFDEWARAGALWAVMGALVVLIGSTLWRVRFGIPYEWWRAAHALLALFVVFVGLVHVLRVGFYISEPWKQGLWIALTAAAMGLLVHTRVVRPWRMLKRPYRVVEVTQEPGQSWTLTLKADGHAGLRFEPGQFAWLTIGESPFALEQHPFSFSSSAEHPERPGFTIKALGDFSSRAGDIAPGTRAFVDGPYGAFTLDPGAKDGAVFIAGGVGITPIMSILRTLRDRGDTRPFTLIYGVGAVETAVFRAELEGMQEALVLDLVIVPREPPEGWAGEHGSVTVDLLKRRLPPDPDRTLRYLVCGPPGLMDLVEEYLLHQGIPARHINAERFDIA
jgi:predicted ferric reductase